MRRPRWAQEQQQEEQARSRPAALLRVLLQEPLQARQQVRRQCDSQLMSPEAADVVVGEQDILHGLSRARSVRRALGAVAPGLHGAANPVEDHASGDVDEHGRACCSSLLVVIPIVPSMHVAKTVTSAHAAACLCLAFSLQQTQ